MSINNRKYIQSTGSLLTRLNEESSNNPNMYRDNNLIHQQKQQQSSFQNMHNQNNFNNRNASNQMNTYGQPSNGYGNNIPQYSTGNQQHNMYGNGFNPNPQNPMFGVSSQITAQAAAVAAQLLNQMPGVSKPSPDMMMMQGVNMPPQQKQHRNNRNSQNPKSHNNYNSSRDSKKFSNNNQPNNLQTSVNKQNKPSTSVTELPETFGLPSNTKKYNSSSHNSQAIESKKDVVNEENKVVSPKKTDENKSTNGNTNNSDDIEILCENYPENSKPDLIISTSTTSNVQSKVSNEEAFRSYLGRQFKGQLAVNPKPQSNFISNFTCISELLNESDYYTQHRCKPFSTVKLRNIYNENFEVDESENESSDVEMNDESMHKNKKLKTKHVIVIDDTNEEVHKPWITPDLIKLIKHRNLLQAKLTENTASQNGENNSEQAQPDEELLKKFKNLRNKVTKLVKKARKDYLAKYIAESKENKSENQLLEPTLVNSLTQQAPPPPPPLEQDKESNTASVQVVSQTSPVNKKEQGQNLETKTPEFALVTKIIEQLQKPEEKSSLKSQSTLMMGLYNQYYHQYIQQYQKQQEELHELTQAAAELEKKKGDAEEVSPETEAARNFELLQKQAAYYAKQQASIQSQLEASLVQSAQQLVEQISKMAAAQAQKPLILNQFTHQQQHHLHQHIHHNQPAPIGPYNQPQPYQPQPMSSSMNAAVANYEPTQQITSQQQASYNMRYNYNMVVS